jgi:hypothetical protein
VGVRNASARDAAWDALMDRLQQVGLLDGHGPMAGRMAAKVFTHTSYRHIDHDVLLESWRRNLSVSVAGVRARRHPGPEDDDTPLREVGEDRARQGVGVAEMLQTSMQHQRIFSDLVAEYAPPSPYRDSLLLELFSTKQAWSAWSMVALAAGHREAELELARRAQEDQDGFVRRVVAGSIAASEIGAGAEAYGLDRERHYRAFRARPAPGTDAVRTMERYLRVAGGGERRNGMMALIDGDLCGFVAVLPVEPPPTAVGVSPPVPLHGLPAVFRLAARAMETALATGRQEVVGLGDLGLHPAVVADHDLGELLHERFVAPLHREAGGSGAAILETVECYLRNGNRIEATRQQLFLHTNTVRYRLHRFESITGCSLRDNDDLVQVWWALAWDRLLCGRTTAVTRTSARPP